MNKRTSENGFGEAAKFVHNAVKHAIDTDDEGARDPEPFTGKTGLENIKALIKQYGQLRAKLRAVTPSGGLHLYFAYYGFPFEKSESRIAPGVDLRSARPDGSGARLNGSNKGKPT
jgi:hypothetical protein